MKDALLCSCECPLETMSKLMTKLKRMINLGLVGIHYAFTVTYILYNIRVLPKFHYIPHNIAANISHLVTPLNRIVNQVFH